MTSREGGMVTDLDVRFREISDMDRRIQFLRSRHDITETEKKELEILSLARCITPGSPGEENRD